MQASQSNTASDLWTSESKPDPTITRSFPSPFSSPIQAARKYFERQKGDAQAAAVEGDSYNGAVSLRGDAYTRARENRDGGRDASRDGGGEGSREQDRRLERSLYEGHSIEAGLNFEGLHAGDVEPGRGMAGSGPDVFAAGVGVGLETDRGSTRAYLAEGDGSEPLFSYAVPAVAPDPEIIRGAISRLARDTEFRREPTTIGAGEPLNFGEVARRVWESDRSLLVAEEPVASQQGPGKRAAESEATESGAAESEISGPRSGGVRAVPEASGTETRQIDRGGIHLQPAVQTVQTARSNGLTVANGAPAEVPRPTPATGCNVEEEPALAHDACNLLSALSLYSELLGSPGVLGEPHRHYAEEMKLLASRSHVLIDRLLRTAGARTDEAEPPNLQPGPTGEAIDPIPAEAAPASLAQEAPDLEFGLAGSVPSAASVTGVPGPQAVNAAQTVRDEAAEVPARTELPRDSIKRASPAEGAPTAVPAAERKPSPTINMADLLLRWGSLLSTMAQGTLEVVFGAHATTPVAVEAESLERILVNLVRNARAATIQGGAIRISVGAVDTSATGEQIEAARGEGPELVTTQPRAQSNKAGAGSTMVLTVDDSGCGMTEAQVDRILGRGEATDGAQMAALSNPSGRRGLGLQIVRELVAASGGKLAIQSQPGMGTRIEVRWPAATPLKTRTALEDASTGSIAEAVPDAVSDAVQEAIPEAVHPVPLAASPIEVHGAAPVPAFERAKDAVGPDGFNEAELRAMMLRLHRGGPLERGPLSRRLGIRAPGIRTSDRGFAVANPGVDGAQPRSSAQTDSASEGAIAC